MSIFRPPFAGMWAPPAGGVIDPDVDAFVTASGATDTAAISDLIAYLKAQSLFSVSRLYPLKSAQNAGSGSTAYGIGGLTTQNMTLVASPTWGASGITFDGSTQYGKASDFISAASDITVFARGVCLNATPTTTGPIFAQWDFGNSNRSIQVAIMGVIASDPVRLLRSADGGSVNAENYDASSAGLFGVELTCSAQWIHGGGRSLWVGTTPQSLTLSGLAQTSRLNTSVDITFCANLNNGALGNAANIRAIAYLIVAGSITDTQRTALTSLVAAL